MDEKDASLQRLKEKYLHKAKAYNEEADAAFSEAIIARAEYEGKRVAEAETTSNEMLENAKAVAKKAVEDEDQQALIEVRAIYAASGVRK